MKRSSGRVDETGMCHLLKYDLHTHTAFSDGRSPVRDMANAAESNGLRGIAITDHVFNDVQAEKLLGDYAGIPPVRWKSFSDVKQQSGMSAENHAHRRNFLTDLN